MIFKNLFAVVLVATMLVPAFAQDEKQEVDPIAFAVADGVINFEAPGTWTKVQPKINFIEAEFSIPKNEGDPKNGRLTIMGAGGSIEANIQRWEGQFVESPEAEVEEMKINEMNVHMVSISGTYVETTGGPFNPNAQKVEREDYQMVAAIIQTPEHGNYFVKLYGPKPTIQKNLKGFKGMIKGVTLMD